MSTWKYKEGFKILDEGCVEVCCGNCDLEIQDTGYFIIGHASHCDSGSYQLTKKEMIELRDFLTSAIDKQILSDHLKD